MINTGGGRTNKMKTDEDILKEVLKFDDGKIYIPNDVTLAFIEKAISLTRQECEIEKHKYAILCMRGREKEIKQAERKECEWKQQANYNAGFKEGQKKDFEKEVVSYYKGKKVTDADALLLRTAKNNFKEGQQAEQIRILELIDKFEEETFGDKKQIINEADLQSGEIEFSLTGELFPVEILQGELETLKKEISEVEK